MIALNTEMILDNTVEVIAELIQQLDESGMFEGIDFVWTTFEGDDFPIGITILSEELLEDGFVLELLEELIGW